MRKLLNIFKDKAFLVKSSLTSKRNISLIRKAVVRATTHTTALPPPDHRVAAILSLGHDTRPVARACVQAIIDRLHHTRNPYVKLKCLIILHNIICRGSFILKDQLSAFPLSARNSLKLLELRGTFFSSAEGTISQVDDVDDVDDDPTVPLRTGWYRRRNGKIFRFRSVKDSENLELWQWIRWYTNVLERNLKTGMVLGCYFSSSTYSKIDKFNDMDSMNQSLERDLLKELDALICMIEEICTAPEILYNDDLVHEIVRLVSQDYSCTQYQIMIRLNEFRYRVDGLSSNDSVEFVSCLNRLKDSKHKLDEMFEKLRRNDAFWELINNVKNEIEDLAERKERERKKAMETKVIEPRIETEDVAENITESTQRSGRVIRLTRALRLFSCCRSQDVVVDRVSLTASRALS